MATSRTHHTAGAVPRQTGGRSGAGWLAEAIAFLLSGLLCCAALIWILQLWRADVRVPIQYGYSGVDLTFECMLAKDLVDNGWVLRNPRLGAPGEQDLRDFPMPDVVTPLSMKIIGGFTSSWGAIVNLYFFAGFLLATWSSLAVLRHFGMARAPAGVAALLFAFAPYHFYRGESHLHLSAYYMVPLVGMVLLWVMYDKPMLVRVRRNRFSRLPAITRKGMAAIAICAILGSNGAYYAFFTILLLMGAGLYRAFDGRNFRRVGSAAMLVGVIALALVLNMLPNIVHIFVAGKNPEVAVRSPAEAELYALKLTQLVLPIAGHRVPQLAALTAAYNRAQPRAVNETEGAALGTFAAAGFCFLLLSLVAGYPWQRHRELAHHLSLLNLCAFLIGTLGGIGSLAALTIWSQFRAYNRISIFIAFFSVMALAAVLDELWRRWACTVVQRLVSSAVLVSVLVVGLLDQTSRASVPSYELCTAQYYNDADFAAQAERWLPHGSMVLQLPFMVFPETPPSGSMRPYDPLIPYLHSTTLRWSYGTMKGRYWSAWQARLATLPIEDVLNTASAAGFGAIYIDRNGYADKGTATGAKLTTLGLARIESRDGRFWLYDIQPYAARMQAEYTPELWANTREAVLHPLLVQWLPQCSGMEGDAQRNWHWCGSQGGFSLENPSAQARKIEIDGAVVPGSAGTCSLRIDGPGWAETMPLRSGSPRPLTHSLTVPPGTSVVRLKSDCQRPLVPTDPRPLVFRIDNFRAILADAAPSPELTWSAGFYPLEQDAGRNWHWCSSSGELLIRNAGPDSENVISMILASGKAPSAPLSITGPGFAESVTIGPASAMFSKRFLIPHGISVVRFATPAAPLLSPNDSRKLVFRVEDLRLGSSLLAPTIIYN
jgi:phosphoglycerol transferase